MAEINAVIEIDPMCAEAHRQLGLVYGYIGMLEKAVDELLQAVNLDLQNVSARNDLALTYTMLGMFEEAKAEFEAVLAIDPNN